MRRGLRVTGLVSLAGAAGLAWLLTATAAREPILPAAAGEATSTRLAQLGSLPLPAAPASASAPLRSGLEVLPDSLRGTEVGGSAEEDALGRLKPTRGLRDLFDYFLSASGEELPARLRERLLAHLAQRLRAPALAQAMGLFDTYLAYKRELDGLMLGARATTLEDMQARLHAVRASRARHFAPDVVAAFFGDEAAYDRYALDKQALLGDARLTASEKASRLAALRAALPESLREQLGAVETVLTLNELTQDWQQRAGDAAELRRLRVALVGTEATERLEGLDRDTAAWEQRLQVYWVQRARIAADTSLADSTRQQQLQALRDGSFAGTERLRIEALERHHDAAPRDAVPPSS